MIIDWFFYCNFLKYEYFYCFLILVTNNLRYQKFYEVLLVEFLIKMKKMINKCPLCDSDSKIFYENKEKLFHQCNNCKGIFVDASLLSDSRKEKSRYEFHKNNVEDEGYQKFVAPITNSILEDYSKKDKGLDFGSGPTSVISKILNVKDFEIVQYDPFFHNYPELLEKKYNYIACCEVIEHFYSPKKEFILLKNLLQNKGKLYCMTNIYDENINFDKWYYKNDFTHVFFYHKDTFQWIKNEIGFSEMAIDGRLIVFTND